MSNENTSNRNKSGGRPLRGLGGLAALSFFTRLPFWRLADIPKEAYEKVVPLWPLAGWVTGLSMGISFVIAYLYFGLYSGAVVAALLTRVLVTGALHEDGFADFCDGFGGGTTRERTLEIMKDSHIGTYGVLGLLFYIVLMPTIIFNGCSAVMAKTSVPQDFMNIDPENMKWAFLKSAVALMIIADIMSKAVSSTIINALPYARKEAEAKNKLIYAQTTFSEKLWTLGTSLLPCLILTFLFLQNVVISLCIGLLAAIAMRFLLVWYMRKKIQGYTGDCCGAMFILCEAAFYLGFLAHISNC